MRYVSLHSPNLLVTNLKCASLVMFLSAGIGCPACAAVFERDWQTLGDGLITYDDVNQREWLDVPVSLLQQFHPTNADLAADIAKTELLSGGTFEDFTLAKREDVFALAQSAGIVISNEFVDANANAIPMRRLIDLLGPTISSSGDFGFRLTSGVLDEMAIPQVSGDMRYFAAFFQATEPNVISPNGRGFLSILNDEDRHSLMWTGMMLYRNVVPEPRGGFLVMVATGISLVMRIRRQFNRLSLGSLHQVAHGESTYASGQAPAAEV